MADLVQEARTLAFRRLGGTLLTFEEAERLCARTIYLVAEIERLRAERDAVAEIMIEAAGEAIASGDGFVIGARKAIAALERDARLMARVRAALDPDCGDVPGYLDAIARSQLPFAVMAREVLRAIAAGLREGADRA